LNLVRFRAQKWAELLHQDPIEEALCNAFAAELLMPAEHVDKKLLGSKLCPKKIALSILVQA
jgi:Zn-dependent peptidase ImmA (M78 family)